MTSFLENPVISRVRRNHGLEHATIHILSNRFPGQSFSGHSDINGFWLMGNVNTEEMADAVTEALSRLQNGEKRLAIHQNCGTNFVTYGFMAGMASLVALLGTKNAKEKLERLPLVTVFATIALILAQPLGYRIQQRLTTESNPGDMQILEVIRSLRGKFVAHRITTQG
jgi:uncharacterized protein YqhQ